METHRVRVSDSVHLEALVEAPEGASEAIVVCHPHPEHGGTMTHPLIETVAKHVVDAGLAAVRFNFRGVGGSTGVHSGGPGELDDVSAMVEFTSSLGLTFAGITGWSFGAAAALQWQAHSQSSVPYVGIAPPVDSLLTPPLPDPAELLPARRTFIVGERDQFVDADELAAYGDSIGASTVRYETADHFFIFRHDRLATDVVDGLIESPHRNSMM